MKQLIDYITEKSHFLVKKHCVPLKKQFAKTRSELKNGVYYKVLTNNSGYVIGQVCLNGKPIHASRFPAQTNVINNEFVIGMGMGDEFQVRYHYMYCNIDNIDKYFEPTEEDLQLIATIEEYIATQNNLKNKAWLGTAVLYQDKPHKFNAGMKTK